MTGLSLVPTPGPARRVRAPRVAERKLSNGLRVLAVRKPTVPRVEARLFVPAAGKRDRAAARVLAATILSGTNERDAATIARRLQAMGGGLSASLGADHLQLGGSVLAANLSDLLSLASEVLTDATFPAGEVSLERDRIVQEIAIQRSQPQVIAQEVLARRLYGNHPYGAGLPAPSAVARVGRATLTRIYSATCVPRRGLLVLVGDVQPAKAIDLADAALGRWKGKAARAEVSAPVPPRPGPMTIVDRPGSVQTNIRIAGPVPPPASEDAAAVEVANTIFGGYFVSRFVENLRERNGYTYSPRSTLAHRMRSSTVHIAAEVGTEVTVPSLVETAYELGRMSALEVDEEELVSAQRYLTGTAAIRIQSQAGLASTLTALELHGLGIDHLRSYPRRITAVTRSDVLEASRAYLAPAKLVGVLVGDASLIAGPVATLGPVEVRPA